VLTMPSRVSTLIEKSAMYIIKNEPISEIGITIIGISVIPISLIGSFFIM